MVKAAIAYPTLHRDLNFHLGFLLYTGAVFLVIFIIIMYKDIKSVLKIKKYSPLLLLSLRRCVFVAKLEVNFITYCTIVKNLLSSLALLDIDTSVNTLVLSGSAFNVPSLIDV